MSIIQDAGGDFGSYSDGNQNQILGTDYNKILGKDYNKFLFKNNKFNTISLYILFINLKYIENLKINNMNNKCSSVSYRNMKQYKMVNECSSISYKNKEQYKTNDGFSFVSYRNTKQDKMENIFLSFINLKIKNTKKFLDHKNIFMITKFFLFGNIKNTKINYY